MLAALSVGLLVSLCSQSALAAFGVTDNGDSYTIDAGSANPLIFTVDSSSCDITSILYRSQEYQYSATGSHIGSGLGSADVTVETLDDVIKVTCTTDTLIHYYVAKSGDSVIYMATYTSAEPSIGELRYIARLDSSVLPSEYPFGDVSTTAGSSETVEGSDVFVVDGETRSKFYSSERFIDDDVHCVYGDDVHACMLMPQYETSSGGPFFRDINTNNGGDMTALYWYMNSGHVQTESYRMGLHGPYAMYWSRSGIPTLANVDFSFMADLDLEGYVGESGRGTVTGTASGVDGSAHQIVLHWYNDDAQYWTYASSSGAFTSPAMKPGTYTMVLYQTELKVAEASVTVTAGSSASANIASEWDAHDDSTLFQIGTWDGKPDGFLNAANQLRMHPSDSRMSDWGPVTYAVGSSADSSVPMALFKGVNDPLTITLALDDADTSGEATLRVGTTLSFAGGRPSITVNDHSDSAAAPTKIDSRGVTRGAYRGYGEIYDFTIPDGTLSTSNTITISVISGSSGDGYLTPNYILDSIHLFKN